MPPPPTPEAIPASAPQKKASELQLENKFGMPRINLDSLVNEVKKETSANGDAEAVELSLENIQKAWNKYLNERAKDTVKNILKMTELAVQKEEIIATVTSLLAENILREETPLIQYLREQLKNNKYHFYDKSR